MGALGYGAAGGAALLFGVQYVPVKKHETHDGSVFQFFLCSGVLLGSLLCVLVRSLVTYGTVSKVSLLLPGFVGGLFWATSNALVIPLVKIMGLGVGFSMYHVVNLMTGYGVGRFGLPFVGLEPDAAERPWMQDLGVAVLLGSLVLLLAVEGAEAGGAKERRRTSSLGGNSGSGPITVAAPLDAGGLGALENGTPSNAEAGHRPPAPGSGAPRDDGLCDPLASPWRTQPPATELGSSWRRLAVSVPLAIAAGVTTGFNAVPFSAWSKDLEKRGLPHDSFCYALSQALGIWMTSLAIYLGFATFMKVAFRTSPVHSVIRPALAAGVCWALGNMLMLVAIENLGFAAAYALDAVGPIMVASIIAAFLGEIRRGLQATLFAVAVALQTVGVALIAVGNGR